MTTTYQIRVLHGDTETTLTVADGANLREVLMQANLTPYGAFTKRVNCGGRGLCATCGVWIEENSPTPQHWHDRAAQAFGYPRLSCQVTVRADMTIRLIEGKLIWGQRDALKRWTSR